MSEEESHLRTKTARATKRKGGKKEGKKRKKIE